MDLGFTMRIRRQRRRDALAPAELPLLFARAAAEQASSPTARVQTQIERDGGVVTPRAQRVALFAGLLKTRSTCASFGPRTDSFSTASTSMKPLFTLALQRSFKCRDVPAGVSNEPPGAGAPARGLT